MVALIIIIIINYHNPSLKLNSKNASGSYFSKNKWSTEINKTAWQRSKARVWSQDPSFLPVHINLKMNEGTYEERENVSIKRSELLVSLPTHELMKERKYS